MDLKKKKEVSKWDTIEVTLVILKNNNRKTLKQGLMHESIKVVVSTFQIHLKQTRSKEIKLIIRHRNINK